MSKLPVRSLHPHLPLAGLALLAACGQGSETPAANGVAGTATPVAEPGAAAPAPVTTAYDCLPALRLSATYDNGGAAAKARLTIADKSYDLTGVPAASGAKYSTDQGRTPGKTLVWWTQGNEGTLYEGRVGGTAADEKKVASCSPARS